jgi:hypothetical protein
MTLYMHPPEKWTRLTLSELRESALPRLNPLPPSPRVKPFLRVGVWEGASFINNDIMVLICQPKISTDVTPCFILRANRFLLAFYITMDYITDRTGRDGTRRDHLDGTRRKGAGRDWGGDGRGLGRGEERERLMVGLFCLEETIASHQLS